MQVVISSLDSKTKHLQYIDWDPNYTPFELIVIVCSIQTQRGKQINLLGRT